MDDEKVALRVLEKEEQRIKILKMDSQRLGEYLNQMMLSNPVMEIEENLAGYTEDDLAQRKSEWLESNDFEGGLGYYDKDSELPDSESSSLERKMLNVDEGETLDKHLRAQLAVQKLEVQQREAAEYILGCLDENGILLATQEEILSAGFAPELMAQALRIVQNLEPLGVGAATLTECLCLQLDEDDDLARAILNGSLWELSENKISEIARKLAKPEDEIRQAAGRIRQLNPRPGAEYTSHNRSPYVMPDVLMIKFMEEYYVALNEFSYPEIKVSTEYLDLFRRTQDRETKDYLQIQIDNANWLKECVEARNQILLLVSKAIVRMQSQFFRYGPHYLRLLRTAELSDFLQLEESTVKLALKNKYLQSPYGVYPLKFFVVREVRPEDAGIKTLQEKIAAVIATERPDEPYTDEKICHILEQKGDFVSDELVERCREALQLPDSEQRIFYTRT